MTNNPYAPPAAYDVGSSANDPFDPHGLVPAGRGTRLGAAMIDGLISMVVLLPIQYATGVFDNWPNVHLSGGARVLWGFAGFLAYAFIHGWFLRDGQTIGKKLLNIQIVGVDTGKPISIAKLLLGRFLPTSILGNLPYVGPFYGLVDALFIFGEDRRCIHDRIAGTRVIVRPLDSPR